MKLPTEAAFLAALAAATRKHRLRWTVASEGFLRVKFNGDYCCPITVVAGGEDAARVCDVADDLGIPSVLRDEIVYAADNVDTCDPALRRRLLAACGLGEGGGNG